MTKLLALGLSAVTASMLATLWHMGTLTPLEYAVFCRQIPLMLEHYALSVILLAAGALFSIPLRRRFPKK